MTEIKTINDLKIDELNANKGTESGKKLVKSSIENYGFGRSILVDRDGIVIAGNKTLEQAKELNLSIKVIQTDGKEVIIHQRNDLKIDSKEGRELSVVDNRSSQIGLDWDAETMNSIDVIVDWEKVGFSKEDIDEIMASIEQPFEGLTDPDDIPEEVETKCKMGDLWELGDHRLLCGDSTISTDVDKLIQNDKPILMVTDPPYGVDYDPEWRDEAEKRGLIKHGTRNIGKVINDDIIDWFEAYVLFGGDIVYVWHSDRYAKEVLKSIEKCDFEIVCQIIWAKSNFPISRGDYHWKHEPCWYAVRKGKKHNWQGARDQHTLWDIQTNDFTNSQREQTFGHGTQKPIECMMRPIINNTKSGQSVYDPFGGSGTTLIASEMNHRKCFMLEIDEHYCDIIIQRWEDFTGKEAKLTSSIKAGSDNGT